MMLTGLSLAGLSAVGCESAQVIHAGRPDPLWPSDLVHPQVSGRAVAVGRPPVGPVRVPSKPPIKPTPPAGGGTVFRPIARGQWAKGNPIPAKLNRMGSVSKITVHHEGWTVVNFTDVRTTAARMEAIRKGHLARLRAGDIGYHYIIDRAGRVWSGRSPAFQGAHVRANNPNNLGIMVLGNFEKQSPSAAQLATLRSTLVTMKTKYRVPVSKIYTHRELSRSDCPGRILQANMNTMRRGGLG